MERKTRSKKSKEKVFQVKTNKKSINTTAEFIHIGRAGLVDGLPNNYNTNYIIKDNKFCPLCIEGINQLEIDANNVICTDEFVFYHKTCLTEHNMEYSHHNPDDKTSGITMHKLDED